MLMKTVSSRLQANCYPELRRKVRKLIQAFHCDLDKYDRDILKAIDPTPYLHFTRELGTHLIVLRSASDYPKAGEQIPYLFGTADREHILRSGMSIFECIDRERNTLAVHHFDGAKLHEIDMDKAKRVLQDYMDDVRRQWQRGPLE